MSTFIIDLVLFFSAPVITLRFSTFTSFLFPFSYINVWKLPSLSLTINPIIAWGLAFFNGTSSVSFNPSVLPPVILVISNTEFSPLLKASFINFLISLTFFLASLMSPLNFAGVYHPGSCICAIKSPCSSETRIGTLSQNSWVSINSSTDNPDSFTFWSNHSPNFIVLTFPFSNTSVPYKGSFLSSTLAGITHDFTLLSSFKGLTDTVNLAPTLTFSKFAVLIAFTRPSCFFFNPSFIVSVVTIILPSLSLTFWEIEKSNTEYPNLGLASLTMSVSVEYITCLSGVTSIGSALSLISSILINSSCFTSTSSGAPTLWDNSSLIADIPKAMSSYFPNSFLSIAL